MKLIARDTQIRQLIASLRQAMQGHLQIVFISGEAGIGKTVLVESFVDETKKRLSEVVVAIGKCYSIAGSQQDAYLPFIQILEQLVLTKKDSTIWDKVRSGMAEVAPEWIQLVPVVGNVATATIRTAQWAHREFSNQGTGVDTSRLMIQYSNAIKQVSETTTLVLWIDDLHWSDNATLDMISFLSDYACDSRIMLIATYRPTDILSDVQGQPHPVKRILSRLGRYNKYREIHLSRFDYVDLEKFLVAGKHNFPPSFIDRFWHDSGGNPLFIKEYITLLHQRKLVREEQGSFILTQGEIEVDIPNTVQSVIGERLNLIGDDLRRLLSYASIQGEYFFSCVLTQLLQSNDMDILDRLNLLERVHQLIYEMSKSQLIMKVGGEYHFIHSLIQQTLYNTLSFAQQQHLHLSIGHLLEKLYDEDALRYASDLALHFEKGQNIEKAIELGLTQDASER